MQGRTTFHAELINATSGSTATIYISGSTTAHTLGTYETLYVTDIIFNSANGGAVVSISAGAAAAGGYLFATDYTADETITIHFNTPYECPAGSGIVLANAGGDANYLIVQGFILTTT